MKPDLNASTSAIGISGYPVPPLLSVRNCYPRMPSPVTEDYIRSWVEQAVYHRRMNTIIEESDYFERNQSQEIKHEND